MTHIATQSKEVDLPKEVDLRHDWSSDEILALFDLPFNDLIHAAQIATRAHFPANQIQLSTLLSIKTGGCAEDCAYCPQAARYSTGVEAEKLMAVEAVIAEAKRAKETGASRYCLGAAWRELKDRDVDEICRMIAAVSDLGLETCVTLGILTAAQSERLKAAGLDYYNHNIDTSPEYYGEIITTRFYEDRLETLGHVRDAGIKVCCGGIVGLGEDRRDRAGMLITLANLPQHPESVPINLLVQVPGTPLHGTAKLDPLEFVRTIAVARLVMPASMVRLSAGRETMSDELQALAFLAGANSIFLGAKLLTTANPEQSRDSDLFKRLGLTPMSAAEAHG
jgi:biotin synthase